jgi:lipopolysaccharide transport system permease protein
VGREFSQLRELVAHLVLREVTVTHRWTVLGWTWPLARQLAQLGVLVLIFGHVVNLGIPGYPQFIFSGLIVWTWFSSGVGAAGSSLISYRHLVFQPRCPAVVIPVVAVVVRLVDLMIALPVLIESCRAVMLGTPFPAPGVFAAVVGGSVLIAVGGLCCFRALEGGFVDQL